ncbi:MAG: hypothetical protein RLY35_168 [Bacteroidota bacterium]|jgi:CRP-like cAMP-binding protein
MFDLLKLMSENLINLSSQEWDQFSLQLSKKNFKKSEYISRAGQIPNEVYFVNQGIVRVVIEDSNGVENTIHFSVEGQFIADYASYLRNQPASYSIQSLEDCELFVLPRTSIDWAYENLIEGQKLGRLLAEIYFTFHDDRIKSLYSLTPLQRYEGIENIFPGILSRVPQHMIASYLGISPVHLSRIKRTV